MASRVDAARGHAVFDPPDCLIALADQPRSMSVVEVVLLEDLETIGKVDTVGRLALGAGERSDFHSAHRPAGVDARCVGVGHADECTPRFGVG
jgi:hypothetical protein